MSESDRDGRYGISRALEAADREIRRGRREAGDGAAETRSGGTRGGERGRSPGDDDRLPASSRCPEEAPWSTHAKFLLGDGVSLPSPDRLVSGDEVCAKLWEVINALAVRRVFIRHTNHLTNRELYAALWAVHLNDRTRDLSELPGSVCHIDLLEGGEGESSSYSRLYADPAERKFWDRDRVRRRAPKSRNASYNRDRHLPRQGQW